jgi:hypothetical protein
LGSGRNAEKDRSSGNRKYTVIAGKAKWKFRLTTLMRRLPETPAHPDQHSPEPSAGPPHNFLEASK